MLAIVIISFSLGLLSFMGIMFIYLYLVQILVIMRVRGCPPLLRDSCKCHIL